jgi:hypothetical protein
MPFVELSGNLIEFRPADDRQVFTTPPAFSEFERRVKIDAVCDVLALWESKLRRYAFAPVTRILMEIGLFKGYQVIVSNHPQSLKLLICPTISIPFASATPSSRNCKAAAKIAS